MADSLPKRSIPVADRQTNLKQSTQGSITQKSFYRSLKPLCARRRPRCGISPASLCPSGPALLPACVSALVRAKGLRKVWAFPAWGFQTWFRMGEGGVREEGRTRGGPDYLKKK